jgi:hypothetical protein
MSPEDVVKSLIGQGVDQQTPTKTCAIENPIQPDDNVGEFGNEPHIQIKNTESGGIEIDSKELAIKLSKVVFDAIKQFVTKGEE